MPFKSRFIGPRGDPQHIPVHFLRHGSNERDSASSTRNIRPCHPELPFTSHKRGIDETWDPAWGAGNSEFQTEAKDLAVGRDRPFAEFTLERSEGLRVTRCDCSNGQEPFVHIEPCLTTEFYLRDDVTAVFCTL